MKNIFFGLCLSALILSGCKEEKTFRLIPSSESGITFRNTLKETVEFNIFNYMYFYNGGGVAAGDVNGDGLPDIYFTANQEPNQLYLNKGSFKFDNITETAGVAGFNGWSTGVTMADVNGDGRLDIYVSYLGDYLIYKSKNQLFINEGNDENGVPKFADRAMEYGLDLVGFSTQALFFDYDRDGDLDMFMLNHSLHQNGTFGKSSLRDDPHALAGDRLLKNENGRFIDVTQGSGIYNSVIGYGLGVVASDVNLDGWSDLYIGNDFHENDYLYINQQDGTFKEVIEKSMRHTSRYTMGVDFADFNNDAYPDLISMDMLPDDPLILKASQAEDAYDVYNFKINYGFNHQFARNTLQLNNHDGTFSEIALFGGVASTDWSWSALFADFNLDGSKDIFVSNGILRRSNDLDYINFITIDSVQMRMKYDMSERQLAYIEKMPKIKIPNYLFVNNRDSTFTNKAKDWGLETPSYSNGTAYADFDNDGDIDIVINNVEDEAFLYENRIINVEDKESNDSTNYLRVVLTGRAPNVNGIGAKVLLYDDGELQLQEAIPTRGYQSSVDNRLIFGTGTKKELDSLVVVWNDGSSQRLEHVGTRQQLTLNQKDANRKFDYSRFHQRKTVFADATSEIPIDYKHVENHFVEFNREGLIPHMFSAEGPAVSVADVNNDGLDDIFLGAAKWKRPRMFFQDKSGKLISVRQPLIESDSTCEDVDAIFIDVDNDKDVDLFVVSGGNEFSGTAQPRKPRLYINNGSGIFDTSKPLPETKGTGQCISASDIDQDGDVDLFLGTRALPWKYGVKPDSYIFINDGTGNFTDGTDQIAPSLRAFGFVKSSAWADMDGDKVEDLVIAAEWSPVTILLNKNGKLIPLDLKGSGLEKSEGWWNVIKPVDVDRDGDIDLIAGNLGLNSRLKASVEKPVRLFVSDFDKNDSIDQVLTHFMNGTEYPFYTRDEMTKQMPFLKKRYLSYRKFAETSFSEMFPEDQLTTALRYEANTFHTSIIENIGNGKFAIRPLPNAVQFSSVNAVLVDDIDGDKINDIILAGNFYPINIQMGRNDAGYGVLLRGKGKGVFDVLAGSESGLSITGETRALRKIVIGGKSYYLAVRNNDTVIVFKTK